MHYYGTRLSENLSMRESASSIYATPHCGDRLFRLTSPLTEFQPLAALRGSPSPRLRLVGMTPFAGAAVRSI